MTVLIKYNSYNANVFIFKIFESFFGNNLKDKILFIFGEYDENREIKDNNMSFILILNYISFHFS